MSLKKITICLALCGMLFSRAYAVETPIEKSEFQNIKVCDDRSGWPPYNYYEMKNGKKTGKMVGFSPEVLKEIMDKNHISYSLEMIPWNRCLEAVKINKDNLTMILQLSTNKDRQEDYLLTKPFFHTRSAIFFNKKTFPEGLKINALEDLKKYKGCGLKSYNYKNFGLSAQDMDQTASSYKKIIEKMKINRCDYLIENYAVLKGFDKINNWGITTDPDIAHEYLSFVESIPFTMGISRKYAQAEKLKEIIDKEITNMEHDGTMQKLEKKWLGE